METETREYLTIAQAAQLMGMKPRTLQQAIRQGKLNGLGLLVRLPGLDYPRLDKANLLDYIEKSRV